MAHGLPVAVRTGAYLVVAAFAEALPDGMNGGKIENIEAHGGDVGQARLQVPESAMPARLVQNQATFSVIVRCGS